MSRYSVKHLKNKKETSMLQSVSDAAKRTGLSEDQLHSAFKQNVAGLQSASGEIYFTEDCLDKVMEWASQEKPLTVGTINDLSLEIHKFTSEFSGWIESLLISKIDEVSKTMNRSFEKSETNQQNMSKFFPSLEQSINGNILQMKKEFEEFKVETNKRLDTIDTSLKVFEGEAKTMQGILKDAIDHLEDLVTRPDHSTKTSVVYTEKDEPVTDLTDQSSFFDDVETPIGFNDQKYPNVLTEDDALKAMSFLNRHPPLINRKS